MSVNRRGHRQAARAKNGAMESALRDKGRKRVKRTSVASPERNPEQSRLRILDAALDSFATHGFGGARVDEIANQAGISKNLIYHYFESKEKLYLAVLERSLNAMRAHYDSMQFDLENPVVGMRQLIQETFNYFVATPELLSLMNTENLLKAKHLKASKKIRDLYRPIMQRLETLLAGGVVKRFFRGDVDPVNLYISISALSYFYLSNRWTLSHIFERDLGAPPELAVRRQHVVEIIMCYLRVSPALSAAPV
jgi:TetR/AcrR family transcriptional regulator